MLSVSLALWLVGPMTDDPIERLARFLEGASNLRATGSFRTSGQAMAFEYDRELGLTEQIALTSPAGKLELRSSRAGALVLDHGLRTYGRYGFQGDDLRPPLDLDPRIILSRPTFLMPGSFRPDGEGVGWTPIDTPPGLAEGIETLRRTSGRETPTEEGAAPANDVRVAVDRVGAPRWVRIEEVTPNGVVVREWTLDKVEVGTSGGLPPDLSPPWGYTPYRLPVYRKPMVPGDRAPDAQIRLGGPVSLREVTRLRRVVLLFTAEGCAASAEGGPTWERLGRLARAAGTRVVHVALDGATPLEGWEAATDPGGELESALGVPHTPYVLAFKPGGRLAAAWAGFGQGEDDEIVKALLDQLGGD